MNFKSIIATIAMVFLVIACIAAEVTAKIMSF
jgi:hypothetical protein